MNAQFYVIVDRESTNPAMSNDGGDYDFGRTVAVVDGVPVAVREWTSADFDYCPLCGSFDSHSADECHTGGKAAPSQADGWQDGELLTDERRIGIAYERIANGGFAVIVAHP